MKDKNTVTVNESTLAELCEFAMLLVPESGDNFVRDIEGLIDIISPLDAIEKTDAVHGFEKATVLREDIPANQGEGILSVAQNSPEGYILVPRTVE